MGVICFFNTAKAWGGGEKWHFEISLHLFQNGYEVFVFAHEKSVLLQKLIAHKIPCKGIKISNFSFLNPFRYARLINLFKTFKVETIVLNLSRDVKIAGVAAKKANVKRIIYRRGSAIPIKNTILNRYYFKNIVTDVLANSKATKETVVANNINLFLKEKIKVIYNGIKINDLKTQNEANERFTLLNLGRLEYQKNQKFLIHIAAELKKRKIPFKMHIGGEGSLRADIENLIEKLGVADNVKLDGFIEKPTKYINTCDVFLLPSFWEGFGYVLAEAALCKKPIIAFNTSSNPELVIDGETGYLVKENNKSDFADKIVELYEDKHKRILFGENGYNHITANFNVIEQLKKIESYLVNG